MENSNEFSRFEKTLEIPKHLYALKIDAMKPGFGISICDFQFSWQVGAVWSRMLGEYMFSCCLGLQ